MTTKGNNQSQVNARELALDILYEILEKDGYSHLVLNQALSKYQYLGKQDRSLITRITEGTLEYLIQIDAVIDQFSKTKVRKLKPLIRTLLRMSVYQILYMDRIPDSAVCNEAVKLAVKRHFQGLKGFVNGVLRTISREKDHLEFSDEAVRFSVPAWLLELWKESYDETTRQKMLTYFLEDHPLTVRCNIHLASKEEIFASLKDQQVNVEECPYGDSMLYLSGYDHLEALEAFRNGWIQVQDLSSSLVGMAAAPKEGSQVLDVCGAPGGKSLHIADLLKGSGHVTVRDLSDYKVQMIEDNIDRSGFSNISAEVWDALELDEELVETMDLVVADLPCSGLGILGKKPDIKNRVKPEDLDSLAELQREILSVVWQYVKPGGTLGYSTCTIDKKENEENVAWFQEHFPFEPVNIEGRLGEKLKAETMKQGYFQILPGVYPCDGFFLSVMKRK